MKRPKQQAPTLFIPSAAEHPNIGTEHRDFCPDVHSPSFERGRALWIDDKAQALVTVMHYSPGLSRELAIVAWDEMMELERLDTKPIV